MSRVWYLFFIVLIAFVAIFIIFLMFSDHTRNHLITTSLQQAVIEELQNSRDDSSRIEKGVYAVNENEFRNAFADSSNSQHKIQIKDLNYPHKKYDFVIRFLNDDSSTDNKNSTFTTKYAKRNKGVTPIRGVQVIAIPMKDVQGLNQSQIFTKVKKSQFKHNDKYVSSVMIQEFDRDTNKGIHYDSQHMNTSTSTNYNNYLYNSTYTHREKPVDSQKHMTDLTDNY